jgi:3-deoxy-D-manno-octulosonate 8-phosphate phosphatase (KDO 8-P phosphatase)
LILEVDGVLTDGQTWQDYQGVWRRYFSVRDSMGLRALKKAGVRVAVVTSLAAHDLQEHVSFVGIEDLHEACDDKAAAIGALLAKYGLAYDDVAFMSEDEKDIEQMRRVGFAFTVPTASDALRNVATVVTSKTGGDGAVLEICSLILQHHGALRMNRQPRLVSV